MVTEMLSVKVWLLKKTWGLEMKEFQTLPGQMDPSINHILLTLRSLATYVRCKVRVVHAEATTTWAKTTWAKTTWEFSEFNLRGVFWMSVQGIPHSMFVVKILPIQKFFMSFPWVCCHNLIYGKIVWCNSSIARILDLPHSYWLSNNVFYFPLLLDI